MLLVFAGLGFRMTAVPFHFYAPDVYQGTSHPNAGLLSTLPKIAGLLVLVRVVLAPMPGHDLQELGWQVALVLSVLTMTLGNVVALWQDNIRRLLAYSSIAHGGYMLIGVAVGFATAASGDGAGRCEDRWRRLRALLSDGLLSGDNRGLRDAELPRVARAADRRRR